MMNSQQLTMVVIYMIQLLSGYLKNYEQGV